MPYKLRFTEPEPPHTALGMRAGFLTEAHGLYGNEVGNYTIDVQRDISVQFTELFISISLIVYSDKKHVVELLGRLNLINPMLQRNAEHLRVNDGDVQLDPAAMLEQLIKHYQSMVDTWEEDVTPQPDPDSSTRLVGGHRMIAPTLPMAEEDAETRPG